VSVFVCVCVELYIKPLSQHPAGLCTYSFILTLSINLKPTSAYNEASVYPHNIQQFQAYHTLNTMHPYCIPQSMNAVWGNNRC